ncbi:MAG TPA: hypothetical protein VGK26_02795 [Thermoanaerobaculia bacterium]|jgi:hypothetical protein
MSGGGVLWLGTLLLLALPGAPLLMHPAFARIPSLARAVLAGAAGAVLVSFTMTVFALLGIPWSLPAILAVAAVLSFLLRRAALGGGVAAAPSARGGWLASALSAVSVSAAFLATAAGSASSPDLIFFWGPKAQRFALSRTVDAAYLGDPSLAYMHAYYPPLVTNLYALASMAAGRMSWTAATLLFPLLLAALAAALPGLLRMGVPAARAAAAAALAVGAIAVIGMEADIAGNGEMPLLLFEATGVGLLLSPLAAAAGGQLLAGLMLAGAVTAKIEGLPLALGAIAVWLWMRRASRPWGAGLRLLGPTLLSLGAWFAFGAARHLFLGYEGEGRFLDFHPEYAGVMFRALARALATTAYGLPYLVPFLCLLAAARRIDASAAIPLGGMAALVAFGVFVYLDRPSDPTPWIAWSAPRVFSPVPMLLALAAARARAAPAPPAPEAARPSRP